MRGTTGHELAAGAIGGSAIALGIAAGPFWAAAIDLGSAAATAGLAALAVEEVARDLGVPSGRVLARAARQVAKSPDAPLAAHAVELASRVRARDSRALRSMAILVGRATTAHAGGIALQLCGSWCDPLRRLGNLKAPAAAVRAAEENAAFVRAMRSAAVEQALPVIGPVVAAWESDTQVWGNTGGESRRQQGEAAA